VVWFFFFLQVTGGKGRGEENVPGLPVSGHCQRRRVKPRAANDDRAWRRCAAMIPADPEDIPSNPRSFGVYFCNFLIVFDLF
jgi:hypothetical protein